MHAVPMYSCRHARIPQEPYILVQNLVRFGARRHRGVVRDFIGGRAALLLHVVQQLQRFLRLSCFTARRNGRRGSFYTGNQAYLTHLS